LASADALVLSAVVDDNAHEARPRCGRCGFLKDT